MSCQVLRCWFLGCAFIALSACGRGDGTDMEGPGSALVTAGAPRHRAADASLVGTGSAPALTFGQTHSGTATYYRATGKGNCSFDVSKDLLVAAINTRDYANAAICGAYIAVSGAAGTVMVRITDRCPGCKQGGLDLSREAFARIAAPTDGRVPVTWQIVAGPVSGPIAYHYMEGTSRYWTAIQPRNHRWPVTSLEIKPEGATEWIRVERRAYNYFVHPKPIPAGPLRVRVTAMTGAILEDELPQPKGGILIQGTAQFP